MKKSAKGFTLIELIIVLAIFSVIMVGALSLVDPVSKINSRAKTNENSYAYVDNIQNYLLDSLEFSDDLWLYQGDYNQDELEAAALKFKNTYYVDDVANEGIIEWKMGAKAAAYANCKIRVMTLLNKDTTIGSKTYSKGQILMQDVTYNSNAKIEDDAVADSLSAPTEMLNSAFFTDKYTYDYVIGSANLVADSKQGYLALDSLQGTEADVQKEITETLDESNFAITIVAYQTKADRNGLKPEVINDISRRYPSATHYTVANLPLFNIISRGGKCSKKYWKFGASSDKAVPIQNEAIAFQHPHKVTGLDPNDPKARLSMKNDDNIYIVYALADEITPNTP